MTEAELHRLLDQRYGAKRAANGWVRIACPTCSPTDAKKFKRGVNVNTLATHCFICEKKLTIEDLLGSKRITRIETNRKPIKIPEHPQSRILPCKEFIPINTLPDNHEAKKLLAKDFLTKFDLYALEYNIGYIGESNASDIVFEREGKPPYIVSSADSLVFPVYFDNELVGWQLRFIPGTLNGNKMGKIKYLHVFQKGKYLVFFDKAKHYESVVVVEGVKKALKFPNGVATLGKGITDIQIQLVLNWNKIIFMYDGEDKTQEKAIELVKQINTSSSRTAINIDPRKYGYPSPDEMPEDVAQMIAYVEWEEQVNGNRITG